MTTKSKKEFLIDFQTEAIAKQWKSFGLDLILNKIQKIEFDEIFYEDKPDQLYEIRNLKRALLAEGLEKQHENILKDLAGWQPSVESKILIAILSFLKTLKQEKYSIAYFEDGEYRIYTPELKYWKKLDKNIISQLLYKIAEKSGINREDALKKSNRELLLFHFNEKAYLSMPKKTEDHVTINLQNGTFEISNEFIGLRDSRPSDYSFNILPFKYDENAQCPNFEKFLNSRLPEKEAQMALAELSACPLYPQLNLQLAAVLHGPGRTGKSTYNTILTHIYGPENVASFTLSSLCSPNTTSDYNRAKLTDYMLNYSSEMGGKGCDPNMVKKFISREPIEARHPYGKPFILSDYCPTMFNVNELALVENTSAYWRRFIFFPFHVIVKSEEMKVDYANIIIQDELPGIFNWLLKGLYRLRENKKITYSPICQNLKKSLQRELDPVASFLYEERWRATSKGMNYVLSSTLFNKFQTYCEECNIKAKHMGRTKFLRRIEENGIFVDRNAPNHQYRVYCEQDIEIAKLKIIENDIFIEKMFGISKNN